MAPVSIIALRRQAIDAGMSREEARQEKDRSVLLEFIVSNGTQERPTVKKAVKKAVKKKAAAVTAAVKKTPARRGRPPKAQPRKTTVRKPAPRKTAKDTNGSGRLAIGKLNYSIDAGDAWKPRKGSAVERIWKSLKKHRDDVDKVYEELLPDITDFVSKKGRIPGQSKNQAEMRATLKYRINRTRFEFAVRTGQHQTADPANRAEYGKGDYAQPKKKTPRKSGRTIDATKAAQKRVQAARKPAQRKSASTRTAAARGRKKKVVRR
jgi:hypothetical protein